MAHGVMAAQVREPSPDGRRAEGAHRLKRSPSVPRGLARTRAVRNPRAYSKDARIDAELEVQDRGSSAVHRRYPLACIRVAPGAVAVALVLVLALLAAAPVRAGHEPDINPALRRFTGMVVAVGAPDAAGHVHSFRLQPLGPGMKPPAPDELRGWRLTVLAGQRFASAYTVQNNSTDEIVVRNSDGPLDGLAARDVFVVEELDPGASATTPPPPAPEAGNAR